MSKNYLTIEKIDAYKSALELSNYIWDVTLQWDKFAKWTIGQQIVRSADSVSANLAEGFGRYHKKDKIKFYKYSFGSMEETKDWIRKAKVRKLLSETEVERIQIELDKLPHEINHLIKFTNEKLKF